MISFSNITLKADTGSLRTYLVPAAPGEAEIEFSTRFREFREANADAVKIEVMVRPYCCGEGELSRADADHLAIIRAVEDFPDKPFVHRLMERHYELPGLAA